MQKLFNNILVPFDCDADTVIPVENAIQIANHFRCGLHMLLVQSLSAVTGQAQKDLVQKLGKQCRQQLDKDLPVQIEIQKGKFRQVITDAVLRSQTDLVLLSGPLNRFRHSLFSASGINRLARKTNCPVLMLRQALTVEQVRNIVLPVARRLPVRKLLVAGYLARIFKARIHLVALAGKQSNSMDITKNQENIYLHKAYQLLKEHTNLDIECREIPGQHIAGSTLQYARQVKADLILVNPGKESALPGIVNRLFDRFIFHRSGIPVMTINANHAW